MRCVFGRTSEYLFSDAVPIDRWFAGIAVHACPDFLGGPTLRKTCRSDAHPRSPQWITLAAQRDDAFRGGVLAAGRHTDITSL